MQIHELPSASPSASDYIPIDNGTATRKATLSSIDMGSNEITFTSGDTSSPSSWQTVAVMASNTAANLMNAISKMVANIRWLYNRLGTSSTGTTATTVTGAIAEHSTKIGNAEMGTTATTLTGAIAEVTDSVNTNTEDIATLNSNINDLNSLLSVKTGAFASAISGASNNLNVWQSGNVVTVSGWLGSLSLTANTTTVIGTIRNVTLPRANIRLRGGCGANAYSPQSDCYIGIGTDGGISVNPSVASSTVYFSVTYVA